MPAYRGLLRLVPTVAPLHGGAVWRVETCIVPATGDLAEADTVEQPLVGVPDAWASGSRNAIPSSV